MTASDKKKSAILALLLVVAGIAWYVFVYRPTLIPAADAAAKAADAKKKPIKPLGDAQIRTDWNAPTNLDVGQKNLFKYREKPVAPKSTQPSVFTPPPPPPAPDRDPPRPQPPPPTPFKAFKYEGFSAKGKNGKILAALSEGGITYSVKEGDCVLGQYCITRITENLIEIQDIVLKRPQTVTRTQ